MGYRLVDIVRDGASSRRAATALVCGGRSLRFAELDERSNRAAAMLAARGLAAGGRVCILAANGIEFFELLFGAVKLGAVLAPVNWRLTAGEAAAVVGDSTAGTLVHGPSFAVVAERVAAATGVSLLAVGPDYEAALAAATPVDPGHVGADDDPVLQLYTSGTTGLPKGVLLSNANFAALTEAATAWGLGPESVSLAAMPMFHVGGSGWALCGLQAGARTVLLPALDPVAALELMESQRVSHAFLVPAALAILAAVPGAADRDWSALKFLLYGASPITTATLTTVLETFGAPMAQVYGLTETTGAISQLDHADHDPYGPRAHLMRSAGRPYDWVALRVADVVTGRDLPPGQVGELLLRSTQVTRGYFGKPEETAAALDDEGWLHTGDAGYVDDEGYLFLTDRIKDMIVSGGENVYPIEVEDVLARHPDVADVAVIGVPDPQWGETVKAVLVARPGHQVDPEAVLAWTADRLAGFKRPRSVEVVAALPRNPSGKVLKRELRAPYWEAAGRNIG